MISSRIQRLPMSKSLKILMTLKIEEMIILQIPTTTRRNTWTMRVISFNLTRRRSQRRTLMIS
jgi:hypothetical protein